MADWKDRLGVVYSTNPDFGYDKPQPTTAETLPPQRQNLRVLLDRRQRGGRQVTLVENFVGTREDLEALGRQLKAGCGVGGSVKDGVVLVQGDHRGRVLELLLQAGYRARATPALPPPPPARP